MQLLPSRLFLSFAPPRVSHSVAARWEQDTSRASQKIRSQSCQDAFVSRPPQRRSLRSFWLRLPARHRPARATRQAGVRASREIPVDAIILSGHANSTRPVSVCLTREKASLPANLMSADLASTARLSAALAVSQFLDRRVDPAEACGTRRNSRAFYVKDNRTSHSKAKCGGLAGVLM